jgi:hypothetical protein
MEHRIIAVTASEDYQLRLRFDCGEEGTVDLSSFVARGSVTEPFRRDPSFFATAIRIDDEGFSISWPGDVDIDADALWYKLHPEDLVRDFGPEVAAG